jgi:hypothetical protein
MPNVAADLGVHTCLDKRFITSSLRRVFEERLSGARVRTRSVAAKELWDDIGAEALMGEMQEMQGEYVSVRYATTVGSCCRCVLRLLGLPWCGVW